MWELILSLRDQLFSLLIVYKSTVGVSYKLREKEGREERKVIGHWRVLCLCWAPVYIQEACRVMLATCIRLSKRQVKFCELATVACFKMHRGNPNDPLLASGCMRKPTGNPEIHERMQRTVFGLLHSPHMRACMHGSYDQEWAVVQRLVGKGEQLFSCRMLHGVQRRDVAMPHLSIS